MTENPSTPSPPTGMQSPPLEQSTPSQTQPTINPPTSTDTPSQTQAPKTSKNKKTIFIILLVVAGVITLLWLFLGTKKQNSQESSITPVFPSSESSSKPLEDNPDYYYESEGTLPYSTSFMEEILANSGRLLDAGDGFGSELIAIGGKPSIYNFSILKPLDWQRDTLDTNRYRASSPDGKSHLGVLYANKTATPYLNYISCSEQTKSIFEGQNQNISVKIKSETNVTVDGKAWQRTSYEIINSELGKVLTAGMDQCYKTKEELITAYVVLDISSVNKHTANQQKILDDFFLQKIN